MWFICEIIDEGKCDTYMDRLSVSVVPRKWLFLRRSKLYCYWPTKNETRKIKLCQSPVEESSGWKIYSCRKLMNGEIYATYDAAKEAELICEDFSTLTEYTKSKQKISKRRPKNLITKIKTNANDFTVEDDSEDSDESADSLPSDAQGDIDAQGDTDAQADTDSNESNEETDKGDDATESDEEMTKGIKQSDDESIPSAVSPTEHLIGNDSYDFNEWIKSSNDDYLRDEKTETLSTDNTSLETKSDNADVNISNNEKPEGDETGTSKKSVVLSNEQANISEYEYFKIGDCDILTSTAIEIPDAQNEFNEEINQIKAIVVTLSNEIEIRLEKMKAKFFTVPKVTIENEVPKAKVSEAKGTEATEIKAAVANALEYNALEAKNLDAVVPEEEVEPGRAPEIKIPIVDELQYNNATTTLLTVKGIKDALTKHLSNLDFTDKKSYNDAVIKELFEYTFFMDNVSWKKEPNRVLLKDSEILTCWREKGYKCDVCAKYFARKESYTNHHLWHTGKSPHKCFVCGKSYTRKIILENHLKSHSPENSGSTSCIEAKFTCDYCPKKYTRKEYLKAHISIHTQESHHKCLYCDKLFTRREHLLNHARIHTGETPFKCELCSKQFMTKKLLKAHSCGQFEKPTSFTCHICSKQFTKLSSVTNHITRSHSTDGDFKCNVCSKCFVVEQNLIFHVKSHKF